MRGRVRPTNRASSPAAERSPLEVLGLLERPGQVQRPFQLREAVDPEERRVGPGDERREGRGGDLGDPLEHLDVVLGVVRAAAVADLVVAQQGAERLAARVAELRLVDLAEELALVELEGVGQVAARAPSR